MDNSDFKKKSEYVKENLNKVLHSIINKNRITNDNIMVITTNLMTAISKYENITGRDKKKIIIDLLKDTINNTVYDDGIKNLLQVIIDTIIPGSIDLIIDISKGKYDFDKIQKNTKKCYNKCYPF